MTSSSDLQSTKTLKALKNLELRVSRIEKKLYIESEQEDLTSDLKLPSLSVETESGDSLEFHIGQYWFAKLGIVVLAIGIAFLLTFPYENLPSFLPILFGYVLVAGILMLSHFWRESIAHIARYLLGGGLILLYFTTLRLFLFSEQPVISNSLIEVPLLLVVVFFTLAISFHKKSRFLAGVSLTLALITAIISDQPLIMFLIITLIAAMSTILRIKYDWKNPFIYGIIISYFTHFLWFINNPFMGHKIELVISPSFNIYFILIYILIFAAGNLFRQDNETEDSTVILSTFFNSFGCYSLFLLITLTRFNTNLTLSHSIISILFLALSIIFWIREKSKYSTFFYAITGYTALSVAIIAQFGRPDYFVWLSWQSMLVISTAIWFRSKFIVVANFCIFIIIFISYLILAETISAISISFGLVALLSARILNWQKLRLELKTELMRNAYLTSTFFIFPYALYHLMPAGYIAISWLIIALLYYALSVILKNLKYRWMAVMTLVLTVLYVFIIGIPNLEPTYRIISFLALGTVLIIISIIYTKLRTKKDSVQENES